MGVPGWRARRSRLAGACYQARGYSDDHVELVDKCFIHVTFSGVTLIFERLRPITL